MLLAAIWSASPGADWRLRRPRLWRACGRRRGRGTGTDGFYLGALLGVALIEAHCLEVEAPREGVFGKPQGTAGRLEHPGHLCIRVLKKK